MHDKLHRHGSYERFLVNEGKPWTIEVARFICPQCRHTVSLLPSFVLPYRLLPVSMVEAWFLGERQHIGTAQYESLLKGYHRHWARVRAGQLHRVLGNALGRIEPEHANVQLLEAMTGHWQNLEGANVGLLKDFGESLLGRYRIHDWARVSRNVVDGWRKPFFADSS